MTHLDPEIGRAINKNFGKLFEEETGMNKWDKRFLDLAEHVSAWSKDPSTKVGCCIVDDKNRIVSLGYNGFPRGVNDCEEILNDREKKLQRVLHAEENAILFAQRNLEGYTLYVYPFQPCHSCTSTIIQAGIKRVAAPDASEELKIRWKESMRASEEMFKEAEVELSIL